MTGLKLQISGVRSDRSTNCATTTVPVVSFSGCNANLQVVKIQKSIKEATLALWSRLHLPSFGPEFDSQAQYLRFCQFEIEL